MSVDELAQSHELLGEGRIQVAPASLDGHDAVPRRPPQVPQVPPLAVRRPGTDDTLDKSRHARREGSLAEGENRRSPEPHELDRPGYRAARVVVEAAAFALRRWGLPLLVVSSTEGGELVGFVLLDSGEERRPVRAIAQHEREVQRTERRLRITQPRRLEESGDLVESPGVDRRGRPVASRIVQDLPTRVCDAMPRSRRRGRRRL
mmetsp:Transcript_13389/g.53724  ORF Transcript_13389/g.53724 Transcript_13389/m.53724 type:complete len:205 (-) Transcript_13389:1061-1675(-)